MAAAAVAALAAGCQVYRPAPLSAADNAQALEARTLDDARLTAFVAAVRAADAHADANAGGPADAAAASEPAAQPGSAWDLSALVLAALYYHPTLDQARAELAEARAGVRTARQIPNPSLGFEDLAYTPHSAAGEAWTVAPLINFLIETGGKRRERTAGAQALLQAARADLVSASWEVRGGVRDALIEVWAAQRRLDLLGLRVAAQGELVAGLQRQVEAGEAAGLELARERTTRNQLELAMSDAQRARLAARSRLAASIGVTLHALDRADLDFSALERDPPPLADDGRAQLADRALTGRSDVTAALAEYAAAESALALEIARQYPDLTLSPGYSWDAGLHRYLLLPAVELPIFNQNQGPIAEARARREQAAARFTALQARIIQAIDGATAGYDAASRSVTAARALRRGEQEREGRIGRLYRAGEIDHPTLLATQLERMAADQAEFDAAVVQRQALAALEDALQLALLGPPLPAAGEQNPRVASGPVRPAGISASR